MQGLLFNKRIWKNVVKMKLIYFLIKNFQQHIELEGHLGL